mgnify:CR=1 FL=1
MTPAGLQQFSFWLRDPQGRCYGTRASGRVDGRQRLAGPGETTADGDLGFDDLIGELRDLARAFPDKRTGRNTRFAVEDVVLAAFSVFWTQSPSFLAHQTAMQQAHGPSNAETLFAMTQIPHRQPHPRPARSRPARGRVCAV